MEKQVLTRYCARIPWLDDARVRPDEILPRRCCFDLKCSEDGDGGDLHHGGLGGRRCGLEHVGEDTARGGGGGAVEGGAVDGGEMELVVLVSGEAGNGVESGHGGGRVPAVAVG
jgi:hypothetical protein